MEINSFSLPNIGLIIMSALLIIFLIYIWNKAKTNSTPQQQKQFTKPILRFVGIYSVYFIIICFLANAGFFSMVTNPPRMILGFVPILIAVIILIRASTLKSLSLLKFISPWILIAIQSFRILVEFILAAFYKDHLVPGELTFHGRNFDLLISLLAVPTSLIIYKQYVFAKKIARIFNFIGLLSLINILFIAIPSVPSTFRIYEMNYLPTYFPGILILFLAPMAIYFHLLSIKQLRMLK